MKTKICILSLWLLGSLSLYGQIRDRIRIENPESLFEISSDGNRSLFWKTGPTTKASGKPALPVYRLQYLLPADARLTGIRFSQSRKRLLAEDVFVAPVPKAIPVGAFPGRQPEEAAFDQEVYQSDLPYPGKLYEVESDVFFQGYHLLSLCIYPFEYLPQSRTLNYYPELQFRIDYGPAPAPPAPLRQSEVRYEEGKRLLQSLVRNPEDIERFGVAPRQLSRGRQLLPLSRRRGITRLGRATLTTEITPDYLIITADSLVEAFRPLAELKTRKGLFARIETVENIGRSYPGSDLPEKIRNYLLEAFRKWGGGLYVLLGGDKHIVAPRMVKGVMGTDQSLHPCDKYYATSRSFTYEEGVFSGNYNKSFINIAGRLPVSNAREARLLIDKIASYESGQTPDPEYYRNILVADAFILRCPSIDIRGDIGKDSLKKYCEQYLPAHIRPWLMVDDHDCSGRLHGYGIFNCCSDGSESNNVACLDPSRCTTGDEELNRNNFLNALNAGSSKAGFGKFHIVYHMDHSGPTGMGISGKDKGDGIRREDVDVLQNGPSYQILMSGGCSPGNFNYDCIGRRFLLSPQGGGVAFIGNTDAGYSDEYSQFGSFIKALYGTGRYDIGSAFQKALDAGWRLHLLGDPEMQVWTSRPKHMQLTLSDSILTTGEQSLRIGIQGLAPGERARLCLRKGEELYEVMLVEAGQYDLSFSTESPGKIEVTATAHNYYPCHRIVRINSSPDPQLHIRSLSFIDDGSAGSAGNNNQKNDAGEDINLKVLLENSGIQTASQVRARLYSLSPYLSVSQAEAGFGNIASGNSVAAYFRYHIDKNAPDIPIDARDKQKRARFCLEMRDAGMRLWRDTFAIDIAADSLAQCNKHILATSNGDLKIEANENIRLQIDLQCLGKGSSVGLQAILKSKALPQIIEQCSETPRSYPSISPDSIRQADSPFEFKVGPGYAGVPAQLEFRLELRNAYGKVWNFDFNLASPPDISSLDFSSDFQEIDLNWEKLSNISGYNIYRCDVGSENSELGSYKKLNLRPVNYCFFNDTEGLKGLTKYYYQVAAVSNSGMEGKRERILAWTSYPRKYLYPVTMDTILGDFGNNNINVADIDGDGKKEIFVSSRNRVNTQLRGYLVGLRYDGQDIFNIDNNLTSSSGFAPLRKTPWAIPAIGDLKREGQYSLITATREYNKQEGNDVLCYSFEDENPKDGKPDLRWSKEMASQHYRGVVLANVDNSPDGSLEIVVTADERGPIAIFDADGNIRTKINTRNTYGAIAVADIDEDGDQEIIHTDGQGICVWNHDGSPYRGSNPLYSPPLSGYNVVGSPVVCDIDNDGHKDILAFAIKDNADPYAASIAKLFGIRYDGNPIAGLDGSITINTNLDWLQELYVGDLDGDGKLEIVAPTEGAIKIWNNSGKEIRSIDSPISSDNAPMLLADVDGDGLAEILFALGNQLHAYKMDGSKALGFPLRSKTHTCGGICVADVDSDGRNEILATSYNQIDMWQTNGLPSGIEWGSERHNPHNTGVYQKPCETEYITSNKLWTEARSLCYDLIVMPNNSLEIKAEVSMQPGSLLIVMPGAQLIVDGGSVRNCNVKVRSGGHLTLKNDALLDIRQDGSFVVEEGAFFENHSGSIE